MLEQLEDDEAHPAVRRNVLRLLQFVEIPKRYQGGLFNVCCELVGNVSNPAAIRAFSLTVAANIANGEPGLFAELKAIAAEHPSAATAALRVRLRKIFNEASDD